jgi:hypothetical protein
MSKRNSKARKEEFYKDDDYSPRSKPIVQNKRKTRKINTALKTKDLVTLLDDNLYDDYDMRY